MVKISLQRQGAKKAPFYHIVVSDSRSPRDGKIIEKIGTYNPMTEPSTIVLDNEKVEKWIKNGAKPTDTVKKLMERMHYETNFRNNYKKHSGKPRCSFYSRKSRSRKNNF